MKSGLPTTEKKGGDRENSCRSDKKHYLAGRRWPLMSVTRMTDAENEVKLNKTDPHVRNVCTGEKTAPRKDVSVYVMDVYVKSEKENSQKDGKSDPQRGKNELDITALKRVRFQWQEQCWQQRNGHERRTAQDFLCSMAAAMEVNKSKETGRLKERSTVKILRWERNKLRHQG